MTGLPLESRILIGLGLSLAIVFLTTPLAIRVAARFQFYDRPAGYKGHAAPTPYLGGTPVVVGLFAVLIHAGDWRSPCSAASDSCGRSARSTTGAPCPGSPASWPRPGSRR
jgi:UDP-N-acetylmuramyl pentapeptide phosphotransferase/UDP-N-acetylglucosamine-1-phosphate transferase